MATYYWVGGSGNWDATSTANWSDTSGGSSGFGPPTSADNVIFDAGSNTGTNPFTVTVTGTSSAPAVCADFSTGGAGGALDGAMTLSMGATSVLNCYGSMTLPATNFTWTGTSGGILQFLSTTTGKTITTNGVTLSNQVVTLNGTGGAWTLGSAFTSTNNTFTVLAGTFDTANYAFSVINFVSSGSSTRTITLGSSAVTCTGTTSALSFSGSNFTFNANTSTITCSNASPTFTGGGQTFYNVTFSSASAGTTTINGANTFNNLTFTSRSATGLRIVIFGANQTVSGTLTFGAANTAIRRIFVGSDSLRTQRTITLNGTLATLADVDFRDIVAAGTAGTWTGTRIGDALNNSNITFTAAKTVYWNLAGTQNWSATGWATTNNGVPAVNNFPLAQDTATFTEAGAAGTVTFDASWAVGELQMADGVSNRTTAFTLGNSNSSVSFYKNITLFSNLTLTGTGNIGFNIFGSTQIITSAGVTWVQPIQLSASTGTVQLADNFTNTGSLFSFNSGTLDLSSGNRTLTCVAFSSNNSNTRSISFGTGQITVTGNNLTVWSMTTATNFSYTGTSKIVFNYSGSTGTRLISSGTTTEAQALSFSVTNGTDTIGAPVSYKDFDFTGFKGTSSLGSNCYGNLTIDSGMTLTSTTGILTFAATSGIQKITSSGVLNDRPITVNAPGATVQLQDNLTIGSSRTFNLTAGTLDLTGNSGNWTLSAGLFASSGSTTRAIAFGTGQIDVTGNNATVWSSGTATNFSYTGTSKVRFTYSGSTGTRTLSVNSTNGTESNALNLYVTAGTDTVTFNSGGTASCKDLDFTGFAGTLSSAASERTIYGNLIISSGMTLSSGAGELRFSATSGTQDITTNGKTLDFPIRINGIGGTSRLQDAITLGATRTLTLTAGTFDSDGYAVSTGLFNGSGTTARTLSMGASTWTITGAGTAWNLTDTTNLTLNTDTSTISMTGSSAHTFAGGSQTYYNLNVGGTGDLTIEGDNTFNEISDSVDGSTVYFTAGSTTTTSAFTVDGASGNLISFRSTTPGSVWYLVQSAGSVGITYVDIQDSDASGGATFQCINGVNSGNNTGWQFINSGVSGGNFLLFF